nr:hypothetical protein Clen_304 [Cedratvirus lena]
MQLSYPILVEVMLNVEGSEIYKLAQTCKSMVDVLSDNYFWRLKYEREGLYPLEEEVTCVASKLHSYIIACKIKKRLSFLDREQSFPQMFVCERKYSMEELRFIFFFRKDILFEEENFIYRLTLGVNKKKEFYFAIETRKRVSGSGFLLHHNLDSARLEDVCSALDMRKLLYRCYMLN